ncbi:MAG TPA: hypothetical protein VFB75_06210 [Burkholderiales bacterium]|nr:hypothetical protein [Burkholderiales bacterium]
MNASAAGGRSRMLASVALCAVGLSAWAGEHTALGEHRALTADSAQVLAAAMQPADLEKAFWVAAATVAYRPGD